MKKTSLALVLVLGSCGAFARTGSPPSPAPTMFSAEAQWGPQNDASPAFTPDGNTVLFTRRTGSSRQIMISHRHGETWSKPELAPFSKVGNSIAPAMAPDGSYLIFVSNRPAVAGGALLDGFYAGKPQPERGGNLWRVDRKGDGWGTPVRLPDIINSGPSIYDPSVARDGSIYFTRTVGKTGAFRLYKSAFRNDSLQAPSPLPFSDGVTEDYDPAVAPDQSFLVFSSERAPASDTADLFIVFAAANGWSVPVHIGPSGFQAHLSPDLSTLYFTNKPPGIWAVPLGPVLAHGRNKS
ncbi:hypothetical protein [Pinirhizobacter sp.]|uniref:hypothetical protein n=1 Tax=Pinirhizobacter sp. TaxID=2950432 RepID=UPI002F425829